MTHNASIHLNNQYDFNLTFIVYYKVTYKSYLHIIQFIIYLSIDTSWYAQCDNYPYHTPCITLVDMYKPEPKPRWAERGELIKCARAESAWGFSQMDYQWKFFKVCRSRKINPWKVLRLCYMNDTKMRVYPKRVVNYQTPIFFKIEEAVQCPTYCRRSHLVI